MSTTVQVSRKRQVLLPKEYCDQKRIGPGTAIRITPVANGLYLSPVGRPSEKELQEVFKAAGGGAPEQITPAEEELMAESIRAVRARRSRRA